MLLSKPERRILGVFRQFLVTPGQMLCFSRPNVKRHRAAFQQLIDKGFLVKERFAGGYSLTRAGFVAMKDCEPCSTRMDGKP